MSTVATVVVVMVVAVMSQRNNLSGWRMWLSTHCRTTLTEAIGWLAGEHCANWLFSGQWNSTSGWWVVGV